MKEDGWWRRRGEGGKKLEGSETICLRSDGGRERERE
jgi:hypothetical protein